MSKAGEGDLVFWCQSGGGTSLLALPAPGITLEDLQEVYRILYFGCGASMPESNAVRNLIAVLNTNHPKYVQEFFFHLWAEPRLSFEVLDQVEHRIIHDRVPEFSYAWDALTLNQRKALKLIAGTLGKNIFAAENLAAYGFRTASQASAALTKLEKGGFLDKNREWKIHDPIFYRWLQAV